MSYNVYGYPVEVTGELMWVNEDNKSFRLDFSEYSQNLPPLYIPAKDKIEAFALASEELSKKIINAVDNYTEIDEPLEEVFHDRLKFKGYYFSVALHKYVITLNEEATNLIKILYSKKKTNE